MGLRVARVAVVLAEEVVPQALLARPTPGAALAAVATRVARALRVALALWSFAIWVLAPVRAVR
jgi:hypothetical protein